MQQELTQSEVEWLHCLTISLKLTPVLPENARFRLEGARLLEATSGKILITESGAALLRQRTPQVPLAPAFVSRWL